jgi:hypothetical protein
MTIPTKPAKPLIFSAHDRTFLGLLDAFIDSFKILKDMQYSTILANAVVYQLIVGGLCYSIALAGFCISGIGILLIPSLFVAFSCGYCHLLATIAKDCGIMMPAHIKQAFSSNQTIYGHVRFIENPSELKSPHRRG